MLPVALLGGFCSAFLVCVAGGMVVPGPLPEADSVTEDATGPGGVIPAAMAQPRSNAALQSDTFFRLTTSAAMRKYLAMMKRPQTSRAIAEALQAGGQVHAVDEKTSYTNVYTALRRRRDVFVQTRNGEWGLLEWYNNKPRADPE